MTTDASHHGELHAQLAQLAEAELGRALEPGELRGDVELAAAFDSMQLLSLVVRVEDHFRVIIEDEDEAGIVTVDDLVAVVRTKLADSVP